MPTAPATVQSTNAAEAGVPVFSAPIQSTNAAEAGGSAVLIPPLVEPIVQSANAAEQGL